MIQKTEYFVPMPTFNELFNYLQDVDCLVLNEPTNDFFYDPWKIKDNYKNTPFETVLSVLPNHGEARIIKLTEGECYLAHADIDDRYHMSLTGNYSYLIDLVNDQMHQVPIDGYFYDMDAGLIHVASNFGELYRYQLVVRKLLNHAVNCNLVSVTIVPNKQHDKLRYFFDNTVSSWLNRVNKQKRLDNFQITNNGCKFLLDVKLLDELCNTIHQDFSVVTN